MQIFCRETLFGLPFFIALRPRHVYRNNWFIQKKNHKERTTRKEPQRKNSKKKK